MTRALTLILGLLMLVQIIYPLGLPGLKRRADAWKIAVLALALILAVATLRPPHADAAPLAYATAARCFPTGQCRESPSIGVAPVQLRVAASATTVLKLNQLSFSCDPPNAGIRLRCVTGQHQNTLGTSETWPAQE
jgi:hypothetical protein